MLGSEGEFVSFGVAPVVGEDIELVSGTITIGVFDAGDFTELRGGEGAVFPRKAEDFILPAGEEFVGGIGWSFKNSGEDIDVTAPGPDGHFLVGKDFKTAGVHGHLGRDGNLDEGVIFCLRFGGAPHRPEVFGEGNCRQAKEA